MTLTRRTTRHQIHIADDDGSGRGGGEPIITRFARWSVSADCEEALERTFEWAVCRCRVERFGTFGERPSRKSVLRMMMHASGLGW